MGNWTKLTVIGKTADLDRISAIMSMLDNGLMIEDYSDFSLNGMYGELVDESILNADRDTVRVSIFVPEEKNLFEYRSFIDERLSSLGIDAEISLEGLNEEDWSEAWKQYYRPVKLGRITIVPAWEKYEAEPSEVIVSMDPGMAFGTGTHETTRLIIREMQKLPLEGARVLDIGTGSGILSICASKLGARECFAYDIDPVAVKVARDNCKTGGCDNITVDTSDLLANVDKTEKYGVCFANIVAEIIIRMLPDLGEYIKSDTPVILSGIIAPSEAEVTASLEKYGYEVISRATENDWVSLTVRKRK